MFPFLLPVLFGGAAFLARSRVNVDVDDTNIVKTFLSDEKVARILSQLNENLEGLDKKIVANVLDNEKIQSVLSNTSVVLEEFNINGRYITEQVVRSLQQLSSSLQILFITLAVVSAMYGLGKLVCKILEAKRHKYSISFTMTDSNGQKMGMAIEGSGRAQELLEAIGSTFERGQISQS